MSRSLLMVSIFSIAISLASCSPLTTPTATSIPVVTPAQVANYSDPFAYCAAVGTIDQPDGRYTGPKAPEVIGKGLQKAFNAPTDAPLEPFIQNSFWRCMGGKVYACTVGANLPCQEKADANRAPSPAETDFCKANPSSDFIPAAVTGRATVFEWRCTNSKPEIVRQLFQPDERGFISNFWYEISP
jgi:hypothetical protein